MLTCERRDGLSGCYHATWAQQCCISIEYHSGCLCFWSNSSRRVPLPLLVLADQHLVGLTHQPPERRDASVQSNTFTNWYGTQCMTAWWNKGSHYQWAPICEMTGFCFNIHKTYHFHFVLKGWCHILSQLIKSNQIYMKFVNVISLALFMNPDFFLLSLKNKKNKEWCMSKCQEFTCKEPHFLEYQYD